MIDQIVDKCAQLLQRKTVPGESRFDLPKFKTLCTQPQFSSMQPQKVFKMVMQAAILVRTHDAVLSPSQ